MGNHFYPIQTVASLLSRVKYKNRNRIQINLLNVNTQSQRNNDELPLIHGLLDIVNITTNEESNVNWDLFSDFPKIKEMHDYAKIMSYYYANRTMCEHVLLIEDDAIASHEWYEKVNEALNEIEKEQNEKKWLCLKLFTSFRFYDFFTHGPTLMKMFTCDFILTLLQSFVLIKLFRFKNNLGKF